MSTVEVTPDEHVRRAKACAAEAGWPDLDIWWDAKYEECSWPWYVPNEIIWRADMVTGTATQCWPCFDADPHADGAHCDHDPLTSSWPPRR